MPREQKFHEMIAIIIYLKPYYCESKNAEKQEHWKLHTGKKNFMKEIETFDFEFFFNDYKIFNDFLGPACQLSNSFKYNPKIHKENLGTEER